MYIIRKIEPTILKWLKKPEIIAVVGPRQSGKTTLINHLLHDTPAVERITFENRSILTLFEHDIESFIARHVRGKKYLFIDEFQYANEGGRILKYIFDTQKIKIIISGSSLPDLTIRALRYLVGRVVIFTLYPFDFEEFLQTKGEGAVRLYQHARSGYDIKKGVYGNTLSGQVHTDLQRLYEEYVLYGGYPRAVIEEDVEQKKVILRNIFDTYLLRDVRDLLGLSDDYRLLKLVKALSLQIGNLVEYQELMLISESSYHNVKRYLHFLEMTYVCRLVRPYFTNKRKEIVKNPKVYYMDTGLRNIIIDDFRPLKDRADNGSLLENAVASQLIKQDIVVQYWRDKAKREVDIVCDVGQQTYVAFEVKSRLRSNMVGDKNVFTTLYPDMLFAWAYWDKYERWDDTKEKSVPLLLI